MKVRIGIGAGPGAGAGPAPSGVADELGDLVDGIIEHGFDSIWLPEILSAPIADPWVALAWAGARQPTLKLGTTPLVTGRNPYRLAKQAATLDALTDGRLLLTLVPGLAIEPERSAVDASRLDHSRTRGRELDEMIPVLRELWAGHEVKLPPVPDAAAEASGPPHEGTPPQRLTLAPLPVQDPLEVWLGGMVPAALERCGRLADGWLPALCTPEEADAGRVVIENAAARAGRSIDAEHFGVSFGYSHAPLSEHAAASIARRGRGNDPADLVPVGADGLRRHLEGFIAVGFSKFVVRPIDLSPDGWNAELAWLADAAGDLQT